MHVVQSQEEYVVLVRDEDNMRKFFSAAKEHVAELKGWD